jgi:CheY-like chemotaxis protein
MNQTSIIIIEDDIDDQGILQDVFKELNTKHSLVFFDNAPEAFNYLMSTPGKPFLIISDLNIPGMGGIDLKRKIDTTDYLRKKAIPFIFLTTADAEQIVDDAYQRTNIQGFFKKRNSFKEIKEQVKNILDYWGLALQPGGQ